MVVTELALKCSSVYEKTKAGSRVFFLHYTNHSNLICILGRIYIIY